MRRCALLMFLGCAALQAETITDEHTRHVVQPGETLEAITEQYLGVRFLWPENWKLNPRIQNPHLLQPGQVLRVIKTRTIEADHASVEEVSNRAEKKLRETNWQPASAGDELSAQEGIRTFKNSSAQLAFNERSQVTLTEYSQIFLRAKETDLRGHDHGEIEIVQGEAEIELIPMQRDFTDIELISGPARATAEPDLIGQAQLRMADAGESARVMVYRGRSEVSASGGAVSVEAGQGLAVSGDGSIGAPETLLERPALSLPVAEGELAYVNDRFAWQPVDGAEAYVIEVCADTDCDELIAVQTVADTEARFDALPVGSNYWQVAAISPSGLRGYESRPRTFLLNTSEADTEPPQVAVIPEGFIQRDGHNVWLSPDTRFRIVARDKLAGLASVEYRFQDSEAWRSYAGQTLKLPAEQNEGQLSIRATDRIGLSQETVIHWQVAR